MASLPFDPHASAVDIAIALSRQTVTCGEEQVRVGSVRETDGEAHFSTVTSTGTFFVRARQSPHTFDHDVRAASWRVPGLPIPPVAAHGRVGDVLFIAYNSPRGCRLSDVPQDSRNAAIGRLSDVARTTAAIPPPTSGFGVWNIDGLPQFHSWADFLLALAGTDADDRPPHWREHLSRIPGATALFSDSYKALVPLVKKCPTDLRHVTHPGFTEECLWFSGSDLEAVTHWDGTVVGDPLFSLGPFATHPRIASSIQERDAPRMLCYGLYWLLDAAQKAVSQARFDAARGHLTRIDNLRSSL